MPGARLRGLLIALALKPGQAVPKGTLVDWIWGEQPPADATNALQRLVSRLRKALPDGVIEGQTDGYRLTVNPDEVDAVRFERLVGQARTEEDPRRVRLLREALAMWRGPAMQDVGLQDSAAFDAAVTRLEGLRLTAMEDRFETEVGLGHGAELITELTDLVAAHPLRERPAAALMRALVAAGRDSEALLVFQRAREALADALGVDPSPELSALHVALLRGELGRREETRKTNLRAELTSFVGKDADVAAVRDLIAGHRLTTVIGPGGSGKTRLATETARTLLGDLPDGAWLVELASIGASGDLTQSTLAALGVRDGLLGGAPNAEPMDRLIAALREREALLILDNCEHVIESAAAFADRVLGECRRLRILATSREPLGITGEALWQVEPLTLPAEDAAPGQIESSQAVQLLRDRAGAVRKDLATDARTLSNMARVCRALDGIPLAIELAAARLRTMSLDQLANRLDDRFRLITAAASTPGEVSDEIRAMVYALGVTFMTDGPRDMNEAEEWIHQAYRFTQRSQRGDPLLGLVAALACHPSDTALTRPLTRRSATSPLVRADRSLRVLALVSWHDRRARRRPGLGPARSGLLRAASERTSGTAGPRACPRRPGRPR